MAMLTNGKGDVLELVVGPRGVTVINHSNDGASTEAHYPVLNVQDFMSKLNREWQEVMPTWMKLIAPTYEQRSQDGLPETRNPTKTPSVTSGPTIG